MGDSGQSGQRGLRSDIPAWGGIAGGIAAGCGGDGGAGSQPDGHAGEVSCIPTDGANGGGGGGGAGRIRINGFLNLNTNTITSPHQGTPLFTTGSIRARILP